MKVFVLIERDGCSLDDEVTGVFLTRQEAETAAKIRRSRIEWIICYIEEFVLGVVKE